VVSVVYIIFHFPPQYFCFTDFSEGVRTKFPCTAVYYALWYKTIGSLSSGIPRFKVYSKKNEDELDPCIEKPLGTIGDDMNSSRRFVKLDEETGRWELRWGYSVGDVIDYLLSEWEARETSNNDSGSSSMTSTR